MMKPSIKVVSEVCGVYVVTVTHESRVGDRHPARIAVDGVRRITEKTFYDVEGVDALRKLLVWLEDNNNGKD